MYYHNVQYTIRPLKRKIIRQKGEEPRSISSQYTPLFNPGPFQNLLPLHNTLAEPDEENSPTRPHLGRLIMRRNLRLETAAITDALDYPRDESGAIQHAHFFGDADVGVHERVIICDHVLVWGIGGDRVLNGIRGTLEQETPEGSMDEVQ